MRIHATARRSPSKPTPADVAADLVRRIQAGDKQAEAELVELYSPPVRLMLLRRTGSPALADDLHQDTFRLVLEKVRRGELREPRKLPGFIHHLARNLFIADCRRRTKAPLLEPAEALSYADGFIDPAPSPLAVMLRQEESRRVRRLLGEVRPDRYREILFRFFIAEDTKDQICADLGLSSLRFNHVLHRARRNFRTLVAKAAENRDGQAHYSGVAQPSGL